MNYKNYFKQRLMENILNEINVRGAFEQGGVMGAAKAIGTNIKNRGLLSGLGITDPNLAVGKKYLKKLGANRSNEGEDSADKIGMGVPQSETDSPLGRGISRAVFRTEKPDFVSGIAGNPPTNVKKPTLRFPK